MVSPLKIRFAEDLRAIHVLQQFIHSRDTITSANYSFICPSHINAEMYIPSRFWDNYYWVYSWGRTLYWFNNIFIKKFLDLVRRLVTEVECYYALKVE